MSKKVKVKCLASFFVNSKEGKQLVKGKRGEEIETDAAQAKNLIANKLAVAVEAAPAETNDQ